MKVVIVLLLAAYAQANFWDKNPKAQSIFGDFPVVPEGTKITRIDNVMGADGEFKKVDGKRPHWLRGHKQRKNQNVNTDENQVDQKPVYHRGPNHQRVKEAKDGVIPDGVKSRMHRVHRVKNQEVGEGLGLYTRFMDVEKEFKDGHTDPDIKKQSHWRERLYKQQKDNAQRRRQQRKEAAAATTEEAVGSQERRTRPNIFGKPLGLVAQKQVPKEQSAEKVTPLILAQPLRREIPVTRGNRNLLLTPA